MTYTALARTYRPTRFADLVGQQHVAAGLAGAVAKNRVAHAYLLTGPRGVGKTTAARILAMALNCERREAQSGRGEPCGTCDSCRRIWSGAVNLDVVEIDAASNRGVDDARDLRERAMYAASGPEHHKVYIIDEAHMLTREAWNALLKILEEPPPRLVFVFATTEPQKIANTAAPVLSRLQRFDFRRLGPRAIVERLEQVVAAEQLETADDALLLIARAAQGGMRDALSILDQVLAFGEGPVTAERVRQALGLIADERYAELLDIIAARRTADVFPFVARLIEAGADLEEFVGGAGEALRAVLLRRLGGEPEGLTEELRASVARHADDLGEGDLLRMLKLLGEAEGVIRRSPHARLHVEALLLQWTLLDRTVELAEVLEAVGGRGRGTGSAADAAEPDAGRQGAPESRRRTVPRQAAQPPDDPPPPPPPPPPAPPRPVGGPLTLGSLKDAWPLVLEAVGARRRMVREALSHAVPAGVEGAEVLVDVARVYLDGLEQRADVVAAGIGAVFGTEVRVRFQPAAGGSDAGAAGRRLDRDTDREERLKHYRAKDPTLDALADALDLELLE